MLIRVFLRVRDNALRDSNRVADDLMRRMETTSDREFRFRSWMFGWYWWMDVDNGFYYKTAIADGSLYYSTFTEIFHSYISWGDFPDSVVPDPRDRAQFYRYYAGLEKSLDEEVSTYLRTDKRNRHQNIMKNVVRLIKPDTWPYLASCLYEAFKENQNSSTLSQVITDLVSDDDFEKFNRYFNYYVGSIGKSVKKVLESEDTIGMVQLIYELTKSEIKSTNYNRLLPTLDYFVLQLKTVLLKPDFSELYTTLNQTETFIQKSFWEFETGRWPEMATFVEHFLRRSSGSTVFWDRLTGQFLIEMKNKIPEMKKKIPDMNNVVEQFVDYIDELFELFMSMIADGDEDSIRQIFKDIRGSKWTETVTPYIEIIGEELTRFVLFFLINIRQTFSYFLYSVVTWQPWHYLSPPTMKSSPPSSTTTSSSLSRLFGSMTGLKMKSIQPALRIIKEGSTMLVSQSSMLSLGTDLVMMITKLVLKYKFLIRNVSPVISSSIQ